MLNHSKWAKEELHLYNRYYRCKRLLLVRACEPLYLQTSLTRLQNGLLCHISYNSDLKLDTITFPVRVCHFFWDLFRSRVSNFISLDSCDRYIQVKVSLSEKLFTNSVIHAARQRRTILRASSMQRRTYQAIHLTIAHIWIRKTGTQCSSNFSRTLPSLRARIFPLKGFVHVRSFFADHS